MIQKISSCLEIVLGTATFQDRYGISSAQVSRSRNNHKELLESAAKLGIKFIDSAPSYGDAEKIIGEASETGSRFQIYTKYSGFNDYEISKVWNSVKTSLENLKIETFAGFYFHNILEMAKLHRLELSDFVDEIRELGIASKVGISVYTEEDIQRAIEIFPSLDLLQVPENILDRRLVNSKLLQGLHEEGVEIHVRSVFLQGLLLMPESSIPTYLTDVRPLILELSNYARERELSVLDLCINYIQGLPWSDKMIVGCISEKQLIEICNFKNFELDYENLPNTFNSSLIDPRFWSFK